MAKNVITDGQAKKIAGEVFQHSPDNQLMRDFYIMGCIREGMQQEIGRLLGDIPPGRDRRELLALAKYCRNRQLRGWQSRWSDLMEEYTEVTVDQV